MKAKMEFDLSDPQEKKDFEIYTHATNWALACWDMDQWLRKKAKYGHDFKDVDSTLDACREKLWDIIKEHDVNLDMIC